ncbi:hypothetical protein GDO86_007359, partial [Hymenochirus boettgeri]
GSPLHGLYVFQTPEICVAMGSTVTLHCNYVINTTEVPTVGWFKWHRHMEKGPEVTNDNKDYYGRISTADQNDFIHKSIADVKLKNVNITDTGLYYCVVSLLLSEIISNHGDGTFLNVT